MGGGLQAWEEEEEEESNRKKDGKEKLKEAKQHQPSSRTMSDVLHVTDRATERLEGLWLKRMLGNDND